MKITIPLIAAFILSTNSLPAQVNQISYQAKPNIEYNNICGEGSNMKIKANLPFDVKTNDKNKMISSLLNMIKEKQTLLQLFKNNAAQEYELKIFNYSDEFPFRKPNELEVLYQAKKDEVISDEFINNKLFTILPNDYIECFIWKNTYFFIKGSMN